MKKYKIYQLVDPTINPDDKERRIRYIGWTCKSLKERLHKHVQEARHDMTQQHTYKNRWINKLLKENIRPEIELIDSAETEQEIKNLEIYYIKTFKDLGYALTNTTLGGDGQLGRKIPDEQKAQFEKPIDVYTRDGKFICTCKSQVECAVQFNVSSAKVSSVCTGSRKTTNNMVFRFKGEPFNKFEVKSNRGKNSPLKITVYKITLDGEVLQEYDSIGECARVEGIKLAALKSHLKLSEFRKDGTRRSCYGKYFTKKI